LRIKGVVPGQSTGDDQGITTSCFQGSGQRFFGLRVVVGAGNQKLIALGPGALLQQLGQSGIAGVFQVRQDKTEGPAGAAPQGCRLGVYLKVMGLSHRKHFLDGVRFDAPGSALAIYDIAGGGS